MSLLDSLRESAAPAVAVEIAADRVSAASLEWRGGQPVVGAHASEALPDGALVPSLTAANAHDRAAVVGALTRLLEKVGRPRRIGLMRGGGSENHAVGAHHARERDQDAIHARH